MVRNPRSVRSEDERVCWARGRVESREHVEKGRWTLQEGRVGKEGKERIIKNGQTHFSRAEHESAVGVYVRVFV